MCQVLFLINRHLFYGLFSRTAWVQGSHQREKLGKVRVFESGQGKVREMPEVRESVFLPLCDRHKININGAFKEGCRCAR